MDLATLVQEGSASLAYLAAVGLVLGSLHGLEPGHAKTMMAAFIVAVRGTPLQALLLGVSAAFSHSIVVWVLALLALSYGDEMIGEKAEPYFMAGSGAMVVAVGLVMIWRASGRARAAPPATPMAAIIGTVTTTTRMPAPTPARSRPGSPAAGPPTCRPSASGWSAG